MLQVFGGSGPTAAGRQVTPQTALRSTPVWQAVTLSMGWVGSLPFKLFQTQGSGRAEVVEHPTAHVTHWEFNDRINAVTGKEVGHAHAMTRGNAYYEKVLDVAGRVVELWPLNPDATQPMLTEDNELVYVTIIGGEAFTLPPDRVLHIMGPSGDGIRGWSPIQMHREAIGLSLAMEEWSSRSFGNSAIPPGVLSSDLKMSPEAQERLAKSWNDAHAGLDRSHRIAVLQEGVKFDKIGFSPADADLVQQRRFSIEETARIFNFPATKLRDTSRSAFNTVEQGNLEAVIDHLAPWATRWETSATVSLLSRSERDAGLHFKLMLQGLLRGDTETRGKFYESRVRTRSITPNELRALEEENPLPEGGDEPWVQMQDLPMSVAISASPQERALMVAVGSGDPDLVRAVGDIVNRQESRQLPPPRERRQEDERLELRAVFEPLLLDALRRMVNREVSELRRRLRSRAGDLEQLLQFLREFYEPTGKMSDFAAASVFPTFRSFAVAVLRQVTAELALEVESSRVDGMLEGERGYLESFVRRYSSSSRKQLQALANDAASIDEDPVEAISERLEEWQEGSQNGPPRAERMARRELVQLGEASSVFAFGAAGVVTMVWRTLGDSCPLCKGMDGRTIGISEHFIAAGQEFVGSDDTTKITPRSNVKHPPLHPGCDCMVTAGA